MDGPSKPLTPRGTPWVTVILALAAAVVGLVPGASDGLVFDRDALVGGQIWRWWTGHLVHFSGAHLWWNLVVVGAAGGWLERLVPRTARWFYVAAPPVIAITLLAFEPDLICYGGLSGLGAGLLVLLAFQQLSAPGESRSIWVGVLVLVALKIALESWTGASLLAGGIRSVPLAHVAGIVCAVAAFFVARERPAPDR